MLTRIKVNGGEVEKPDGIDCKVLGVKETRIKAKLKTLQKQDLGKIDVLNAESK